MTEGDCGRSCASRNACPVPGSRTNKWSVPRATADALQKCFRTSGGPRVAPLLDSSRVRCSPGSPARCVRGFLLGSPVSLCQASASELLFSRHLQNSAHRTHHLFPLARCCNQPLPTSFRELVVACSAVVVGNSPFRGDQFCLLQSLQR